jgi:uncharacterized membrane protein (DUF4010 family)
MNQVAHPLVGILIAIGIGLLLGAERERRKSRNPRRGTAGVRTFALACLAGAIGLWIGGPVLLTAVTLGAVLLAAISYKFTAPSDPGITSEVALVVAVLLGALAMRQPLLAAGLGVVVTILLAARTAMHKAVRDVLSEQEAHDALVFVAATLVVLPLLPDRTIDPWGIFNPRKLWLVVILVLFISGLGYIAIRSVGPKYGLPLAGFLGGFVSASATIASMGARAKESPDAARSATAGAILSSVATVIQMFLLLLFVSPPTLRAISVPLFLAGAAAIGYSVIFLFASKPAGKTAVAQIGRPFELKTGLVFALLTTTILFISFFSNQRFGSKGADLAAALGGLVDTHAAAISVASLVRAGSITPSGAVVPILASLSTNSLVKALAAFFAGGPGFGFKILPGLVLFALAPWLSLWLGLFQP